MDRPPVEDALADLRRAQADATAAGDTDKAVLLNLVVVMEELSAAVDQLAERVARIERRLSGTHPQPG